MPINSKKTKLSSLFKFPTIILILTLVLAAYKFLPGFVKNKNVTLPEKLGGFTNIIKTNDSKAVPFDWRVYDIKEYRVAFKTPPLLLKRQFTNQQDYLFFMKFEENKFSQQKGVAVGVTNRNVAEEIEMVKVEISKNSTLVPKEEKVKVDGFEAIKLSYEKDINFESRSIVVVNNGKITVSISTVPEQIDALSNSLDFY